MYNLNFFVPKKLYRIHNIFVKLIEPFYHYNWLSVSISQASQRHFLPFFASYPLKPDGCIVHDKLSVCSLCTEPTKKELPFCTIIPFTYTICLYIQILYCFKSCRGWIRFRCKIFHLAQKIRFIGKIRMQYPFSSF